MNAWLASRRSGVQIPPSPPKTSIKNIYNKSAAHADFFKHQIIPIRFLNIIIIKRDIVEILNYWNKLGKN
jgi:hypothetical protein